MLSVAQSMGIELPVAARALDCCGEAAKAGWGDRDGSNLAVYRVERAKAAKR
jgi:3-hydroxyisobutyrate dehydrogenase-like beta-hydroxyacid dehydrogenase